METKFIHTLFAPKLRNALMASLALAGGALTSLAAPIPVPNGSFESQFGNPSFYGLSFAQDNWQRTDRPVWFTDTEQLSWFQTTANFINPPTGNGVVLNAVGAQASYILSIPTAGIFQDYSSVDWAGTTHSLNATFQAGQSYQVTAGIFGEGLTDGAQLAFGLYYHDGLNAKVPVGTPQVITFHAADFPFTQVGPYFDFNLIDFTAGIPTVLATDAWAGQYVGIDFVVASGDGTGQWILDNVRLESVAVPEPSTLGLAGIGLGGLLLRRSRAVRRE